MARTARGRRIAVVAGHPLASAAALRAIDTGGDLVDAAIAASAVLAVVSTHANSIGGDGFALVRRAGVVHALNASGPAPRRATLDAYRGGIPTIGPRAAVVPGLVGLWGALHERFGRAPWRGLFDAAVDAARDGHPLSAVLARNLAVEQARVGGETGFGAVYSLAGRALEAGATFRQPALARTLAVVADGGAAAFYRGPIAASVCAAAARTGGLFDVDDLASFAPVWCEPIAVGYRDRRVIAFPPNAYGALALMQLSALGGLDSAVLRGADVTRLDVLMRATFAALAEAKPRIADPRVAGDAAALLLGAATTARLRAALEGPQASAPPPVAGGTTGVVIARADGDAVVVLQSNFQPFGCGFVDDATGVLLNNRMMCFATDPRDANCIAPGKRPAHTHNPMLVEDDREAGGGLVAALATPGGISQTVTCTQVLVNLLDRDLPIDAAIDAPRWSTDRFGAKVIETAFPEALVAALAARGHDVRRASGSNFFGSVKAVLRAPDGALTAAADERREASAAAQ